MKRIPLLIGLLAATLSPIPSACAQTKAEPATSTEAASDLALLSAVGSLAFKTNFSYMDNAGWTTAECLWATGVDNTSGFIAIGFYNDQTEINNYGRVVVTDNAASQNLVIGGFAYEDSGAGIVAGAVPETSSLALLAWGATGLLARRRRTAA